MAKNNKQVGKFVGNSSYAPGRWSTEFIPLESEMVARPTESIPDSKIYTKTVRCKVSY